MFSRRERFSRALFPEALKAGRRVASEHFRAVIPTEGSGYAVVIPKKVVKSAVSRHLLKRRILGALREICIPKALILFPNASVVGVHYQDLKAELQTLLKNV